MPTYRLRRGNLRSLLVLAALVHTRCGDPPTAPSDPVRLTVIPERQWAGAQVELTAAGFAILDGDAVEIGGAPVDAAPVDADRVRVRVPTTADGTQEVRIRREGNIVARGQVEAFGLVEYRSFPIRFTDMLSRVPSETGISLVGRGGGAGASQRAFAWIELSTGVHRTFENAMGDPSELYRVGVDPLTGELYHEWAGGEVHRGRIVGGELVDRGWVPRPCQRWGCEPLAGDIWFRYDYPETCRVVQTPDGESCEFIAGDFGDDPQRLERLWSADVALLEAFNVRSAFRISTGEIAYRFGPETPNDFLGSFHLTTDEGRGLFYVGQRLREVEGRRVFPILAMRGTDGAVVRSFALEVDSDMQQTADPPRLGFDPVRDLLLVHRSDTRTLELRNPESFELRGEISVADHPPGSLALPALPVLVDPDADRAYLVYAASASQAPIERGTSVAILRLLPASAP